MIIEEVSRNEKFAFEDYAPFRALKRILEKEYPVETAKRILTKFENDDSIKDLFQKFGEVEIAKNTSI